MRQPHDDHPTRPTLADMDAIYDQYVKPLEGEHWGEFVVVSPDGRTLLAETARDASFKGRDAFGYGNYVFKIGPRAVGRI